MAGPEDARGNRPLLPTTKWGRGLAFTGAFVTFLGLIFGNLLFLLAGLFLVAAVYLSRREPDLEVRVSRTVDASRARAREAVTVHWRIRWRGGPGVAVLAEELPDPFELHQGSNLRVVAASALSGEEELTFQVGALRRGAYALPPSRVAIPDPLGIAAPREQSDGEPHELVVEPPTNPPAKLRTPAGWGTRLFPAGDRAKAGARGSDFRELRAYEPGDPMKYVNWRATARRSAEEMVLVVNEFEPEGKQAFWILLDIAPHTDAGTTNRRLIDDLIDGALTVAQGLIKKGYRVGFSTFGADPVRVQHPDGGIKQYRSLVTLLGALEPAKPEQRRPMAEGVAQLRAFLVREKPTILVFTRLGTGTEELAQGITAARAAAASRGRVPANAFVFAPHALPLDHPAEPLQSALEAGQARRLERAGIRVVRWDGATSLAARLGKGGI